MRMALKNPLGPDYEKAAAEIIDSGEYRSGEQWQKLRYSSMARQIRAIKGKEKSSKEKK